MATGVEMTNAFEEVVPSSASASASTKAASYDVFLNHRGTEVKYSLASSIYDALNRLGIRVFLDKDELELGDFIPTQIQEAMQSSFLHIAIFSPSYAESPWCLAELSFMLKTGNRIIPVFYNVEPMDLRWATQGKGMYANAFSKHEANGRYSSEKLEEWKTGLQSVSYHDGVILKNEDDEGRLLKSIVNCVIMYMKRGALVGAKHPVGLDDIVQDFENCKFESSRNVKIVGIVGMGGSGKTTLAKELYNHKFSSFDRCSCLLEVRDATGKKDLYNKQKRLIKDLDLKGSSFDNVEEGKTSLASCLRSPRLFIILDNVDHIDQLDALLPGIDRLGQGSLILVTSRELGVLKSWGISSIYRMKGLHDGHASQLLCWHAFLQLSPPKGFEGLVQKFVDVCKGLPLSLEVFGGQLYGKPQDYWESQLDKINRLMPKGIKTKLEISYNALDEEEKEIFLDIACFFIGKEKSLAIAVWDGSGWSGLHSCETLVNKCLIELDGNNCIKMHDQLRDLGKEIAIKKSPYRIWLPKQISDIQKQAKRKRLIRGIEAERHDFYEDFATKTTEGKSACSSHQQTYFQECMEVVRSSSFVSNPLELLVVRGDNFTEDFATLSTSLVWLRWLDFPHGTLPSWLSLKNLRVLELQGARHLEELWRDDADRPVELRELIITGAWMFESFPRSIGRLKKLKKIKIVLDGGFMSLGMFLLPEELRFLKSLEHLVLLQCTNLTELPSKFGDLTNLRHLELTDSMFLEMLPISFKQLIHLEYINLSGCTKLTITSENVDILDDMTKLEILNFQGCQYLQVLPFQITNKGSLRELNVRGTGLRKLPKNFDQLNKLELLNIGSPCLKTLPDTIGNLFSFTRFELDECLKLESLPNFIGKLSSLNSLKISGKLKSLPDSIRNLSSLTKFEITKFEIHSCPKLKSLAFLSGSSSSLCNLKFISLKKTGVSSISIFQQCCPSLETLLLSSNGHLIQIEALPVSVKTIELMHCEMLKSISGISGLVHLQKLVIKECGKLDKLPSFSELVSLEMLEASSSACNISAIKPCLQTIEKQRWPSETMIWARSVRDMDSIVKSFAFPSDFTLVDSFMEKGEVMSMTLKCRQMRSSNAAAMVCLVINFKPEASYRFIWFFVNNRIWYIDLKEGKWLWVGVFTHASSLMAEKYHLWTSSSNKGKVEVRGMLVMGEQEGIVERFLQIIGE